MKMIKSVVVCLFLIFCAVNIASAQSYKEEGIRIGQNEFKDAPGKRVGPVSIKAMLATALEYDSNIFWAANNKKHDLINVTSPSILLELPLGIDQRHILQAMYRADINTYSNYKSENHIDQTAAFNGDFKLPFGYFNVQDVFDHTSDRSSTEFTTRVKRTDNKVSTDVGVEFNKLAMETGYSGYNRWYDDDTLSTLEYREDVISETAYYQLFPKTKALVEYDHGFIKYSDNSARDGDYDQIRVGLKGDITGKTQALIKVGYQARQYDAVGPNGYEGFVAEAGTITQFSERTRLTLKYIKTAQESTFSNNNYFDMNYFAAILDQKLFDRLSMVLTSDVSRNVYPEVDPTLSQQRQDTIIDEGIAFKYDIQDWAAAKLGYNFREDISSIRSQNYNDHLWTAGFEFKI